MSFYRPDAMRSITQGDWIQRPQTPGALTGIGTDTRADLTDKVFVAIKGDRFDGHDYLDAAIAAGSQMLIVERQPRTPIPSDIAILRVGNTRLALGKLAKAYRRTLARTKVIAVVGSAGKTTTKLLIHAVLSQTMRGTCSPKSFNNDIGVPLTILAAEPDDEFLIVEVGTNSIGEVPHLASLVEPDIAVITMIGREHLEGLKSLEHIAIENGAVLDHLRPGGLAVINSDASLLRSLTNIPRNAVLFGEAADADLRLTDRGQSQHGWWFQVNRTARFGLSLPGKHNAVNALATVAIARFMGIPDQQISQALAHARGAPMRLEVERIGSITIYNDAYNANPDSMIAALHTFAESCAAANRRIVVLGDMLELGPQAPQLHAEIGKAVAAIDHESPIDHAVFVGDLSRFAAAEVCRTWTPDRITLLPTLTSSSAADLAHQIHPGDAVLIKGSRGMMMERVANAIRTRHQSTSLNDSSEPLTPPSQPSAHTELVFRGGGSSLPA